MRERTSILEFGVDSADCSVQSAGSMFGGGLPKLAMSEGQLYMCARCKEKQRPRARYCFAQRCKTAGRGEASR